MEHQRIGNDAVRAKTGRAWAEWFEILDEAGAAELDHRSIVALLEGHEGLTGWWRQSITVAYEQARGLREKHQKTDGFEVSASRTVSVSVEDLYAAWEDPSRRAEWLEPDLLEVSRVTPGKSIRGRWGEDSGRVDIGFSAKGERKSHVALNHGRLGSADEAARFKAFWGERLQRLKDRLERGSAEGG
jgi:hypothetical protein